MIIDHPFVVQAHNGGKVLVVHKTNAYCIGPAPCGYLADSLWAIPAGHRHSELYKVYGLWRAGGWRNWIYLDVGLTMSLCLMLFYGEQSSVG